MEKERQREKERERGREKETDRQTDRERDYSLVKYSPLIGVIFELHTFCSFPGFCLFLCMPCLKLSLAHKACQGQIVEVSFRNYRQIKTKDEYTVFNEIGCVIFLFTYMPVHKLLI